MLIVLTIAVVALVLIVLCNVALLAIALTTLTRARRMVDLAQDEIRRFFEPAGENAPSPFAELIDKAAAILSARIISSAQAALRGSAGGAAKAGHQEEQAEAVAANPLLGLLGGSKLGKNPLAVMLLSALGNKIFGGSIPTGALPGGSIQGNNGGSNAGPKFRLGG